MDFKCVNAINRDNSAYIHHPQKVLINTICHAKERIFILYTVVLY